MRKKELLELVNKQKKQLETRNKVADNIMDIFKILAEGGEIAVHIHPDSDPSYFVRAKDSKQSDFNICSRKIFEGLYSRGLLVVTGESVHEKFAVQRYVLRTPKEK